MSRFRQNERVHFYVPYHEYWNYEIGGIVLALILMFVILPTILYFPIIKPHLQQQSEVVNQIEQGDVDVSYGDVSEFSTHSNAYARGQEYDGKIVSFTGQVGVIRSISTGEYGDSIISINSDISQDEWCADCGINDIKETDLEQEFKEGDKVVVTGELYHSSWVIELRNCKIEHYK